MRIPLDFKDYRPLSLSGPVLPFQFGFESEFGNTERCLEFYELRPEIPLIGSPDSSLRAFCLSLSHGDKRTVLDRKPGVGPAFLPAGLHRDDTGNVELVMGPYDSFEAFERETSWVNENLGVGSLQAMVSLPPERFFGPEPKIGAELALGWLNFFNELDILERMKAGRKRFEARPDQDPLRSFLHPYLGPMIALRHRLLKKFLRQNALGEMLDEESLVRPARRDQSFKFVGSTAYRPDIAGPKRFCLEVRDAHRDPELLQNRVARIIFYWGRSRAGFAAFADIAPFDSAQAFESLPLKVQTWLKEVAPSRAPEVVKDFEKARFTYEVYRNFSYPVRDWAPWSKALGFSESRTLQAQGEYVLGLENLAAKNASCRDAQGLLARFAQASGLYEEFRRQEEILARQT